jgi:hypothetical protein
MCTLFGHQTPNSMIRDLPDAPAPVKKTEATEDGEEEEDEGEQPILGHVSMATDLVCYDGSRRSTRH